MPMLLYVVQPLTILAVLGTLTATLASGSFVGSEQTQGPSKTLAQSVELSQVTDPQACLKGCEEQQNRCFSEVNLLRDQCNTDSVNCNNKCQTITDPTQQKECFNFCSAQLVNCQNSVAQKEQACKNQYSTCFNQCQSTAPQPAPQPAPFPTDCLGNCKLSFEQCAKSGLDMKVCEEKFRACSASCPVISPIQPQPSPQPQPVDCLALCNQNFEKCIKSGADSKVCDEEQKKCFQSCSTGGFPGFPGGFPPGGLPGQPSQFPGQPGFAPSHPPQGIPLGPGFFGTGPGGCTNPEECQQYCSKKEHQRECESFFKKFETAPRGFEIPPGFEAGEIDEEKFLEKAKAEMRHFLKGVEKLASRINRLKAKKVEIPEDVQKAFDTLKNARSRLEQVKTFDELEELAEDMRLAIELLNDRLEDLERLAEFPRVKKQAERELRRVEAQLKRTISRATAAKVDVADLIKEIETEVANLKDALLRADGAAKLGDSEGAFRILEEEFFERLGELGEKFAAFEAVIRAPSELSRIQRDVRRMESLVRRLKARKIEVNGLENLLSQIKEKVDELKEMIKQRPLPIDEIIDLVKSYQDLRDEFEDLANELQGIEEEPSVPIPKFERIPLPSGLPLGGPMATPREPGGAPVQ